MIIFVTIIAGVSSFIWACVWAAVKFRELDIQERAIEDAKKLQEQLDTLRNDTAKRMVSDYIRNITEE